MISVKSVKTYFGINTERVAIPLTGFLPGDVFVETDTSETYQFNGMAWVQIAGSVSGSFLEIANNLSDLNNAGTARANLGLVAGGTGDIWVEKAGDTMSGGLIINDSGGDNDTRIEGDTEQNLIFVDAGNNAVGLGTNAPGARLHVVNNGVVSIFERNESSIAGLNIFYNPNTTDGNSAALNFATDSTGTGATALRTYLQLRGVVSVHNHSTMSSQFEMYTYVSGVLAKRLSVNAGLVVGSPTGGDKGIGTINAQAVYDDNTLLTDFVFEDDYQFLSIDEMKDFYIKNKHLPTIPGRKAWETEGKFSLGKLVNHLWETIEIHAIYISQLESRLKVFENG